MNYKEISNEIFQLQMKTRKFEDVYEIILEENDTESKYKRDLLFECVMKLKEFNSLYKEFNKNVVYEGKLFKNDLGRYEVDGYYHYYTSGDIIYFYDNEGELSRSRVEHFDGDYYIVGYKDVDLNGLLVQIRK